MTQPRQTELYTARRIFYGALAVVYAVVVGGWLAGNGSMLGFSSGGLVSLARLFGMLAGFSVLLQVFLMSRVPFIDQRFNLHEIVRLHRWNGYAVVSFLTLHVTAMTIGYAGLSEMGLWAQFLQLVTSYRDVFKALLAAPLILTATTLSIGFTRRRVPYEFWYFVHLSLYAAILLALFHQINTGGDIIRGDWFRYFWLGLYVFVFGVWGYFRVLRIGLLALRHDFRIARIEREADGLYSVYLGGNNLQAFSYEPGQYAAWRVLTWRTWWQHHPYSFTSVPGSSALRYTINQADGPFTRAIPQLAPGTRLLLDGPRGLFTARRVQTKRAVLIAGGIGIAPYMPLIPQLLELGHEVHLLYAAQRPLRAAFGSELKKLQANGLKLQYFYSDAKKRITGATLKAYAGKDTTFFICGPEAMAAELSSALAGLEIPKNRIVTERFKV